MVEDARTATRTMSSPHLISKSREEGRHDQTYEGLFTHIDGMRAKTKETEAEVAACQER